VSVVYGVGDFVRVRSAFLSQVILDSNLRSAVLIIIGVFASTDGMVAGSHRDEQYDPLTRKVSCMIVLHGEVSPARKYTI
jgi:hypothetical protein